MWLLHFHLKKNIDLWQRIDDTLYFVLIKTQIYTYSFIRRPKYYSFLWMMLACSCSCIHLRDRRNNRKSIEPVLIRQENEWFFFFETTMHDVMRFMSTFRKMSWKWFDNFYKVKHITVPIFESLYFRSILFQLKMSSETNVKRHLKLPIANVETTHEKVAIQW